ncbi:DUF4007 family protein [Geoalkalibacter halelectricus]|uniref:DUF4007 family protein n=1 Tax=Geoalkalibacter halelectricus TaxID=2847045 RepID=UPI002670147C|nr:DUF4007 family protein [Geoalkalibacter halelectricus]MDO3380528.1 DUF4007 family protein [Geoalkalibacter halelectricus]
MLHGAIYPGNYRPQFAGHETFPLRYGWLKKSYDGVLASDYLKDNRSVFTDDDAIARFGVGKNMVMSMRHWAASVGIINDDHKAGMIKPTALGEALFGSKLKAGLDPYLENPASLWLIHWQLCSTPKKTTWHYVFNHFPGDHFDRAQLIDGLEKLSKDRNWSQTSSATIRRDVECFVRTYVAKPFTAKSSPEDSLECPLAELGLIKPIGKRDGFRLVRGSKPTLGHGVFLYALVTSWRQSRYQTVNQLPFDFIAHAPGSPGRVFLMDENELAGRLMDIESYTNGVLSWSETSGIKAIVKNPSRYLRDRGNELPYIFDDFK